MTDYFYRAFEDKFRGSRDLIKSRLRVYLPFVQPLRQHYPEAGALDLGCGRGEWLELLVEAGFSPEGVDLDEGMLEACRGRGLTVHRGDAIMFLGALPDASQAIVSGFHIAEHLPFDVLQTLVKEALRVLVPGGLLILETPNPENVVVGTAEFYLDPTHQRPLPPQLLGFLPEFLGFRRSKILRVQESAALAHGSTITLLDVLGGVSPDYAVVAQKDGPNEVFSALSGPFGNEYGLLLGTLTNRYDQQAEARVAQVEAKVVQVEARVVQVEARAEQYLQQLHAVYSSTSWHITAPLRRVAGLRAGLSLGQVKAPFKSLLRRVIRYADQHPSLRSAALVVLNRFPALKQRLVSMSLRAQARASRPINVPEKIAHLNPRARRIYAHLKSEQMKRHEESR